MAGFFDKDGDDPKTFGGAVMAHAELARRGQGLWGATQVVDAANARNSEALLGFTTGGQPGRDAADKVVKTGRLGTHYYDLL